MTSVAGALLKDRIMNALATAKGKDACTVHSNRQPSKIQSLPSIYLCSFHTEHSIPLVQLISLRFILDSYKKGKGLTRKNSPACISCVISANFSFTKSTG